jgi:hypothetical protein
MIILANQSILDLKKMGIFTRNSSLVITNKIIYKI